MRDPIRELFSLFTNTPRVYSPKPQEIRTIKDPGKQYGSMSVIVISKIKNTCFCLPIAMETKEIDGIIDPKHTYYDEQHFQKKIMKISDTQFRKIKDLLRGRYFPQ